MIPQLALSQDDLEIILDWAEACKYSLDEDEEDLVERLEDLLKRAEHEQAINAG